MGRVKDAATKQTKQKMKYLMLWISQG